MSKGTRKKKPFSFKPARKCIYCGIKDVKLTEEHIIPYSLNGI
jgi:5-methylcytosine-specific restriction endonuclease McrA